MKAKVNRTAIFFAKLCHMIEMRVGSVRIQVIQSAMTQETNASVCTLHPGIRGTRAMVDFNDSPRSWI